MTEEEEVEKKFRETVKRALDSPPMRRAKPKRKVPKPKKPRAPSKS